MRSNRGFTLIELVVVITILGLLAVVAVPKFINMSSSSRIAVVEQIEVSVKTANDLVNMKAQMPSYSTQAVPNRDDLLDVDLTGDGVFETRLKWGYLDNTDIVGRIIISEDFVVEEQGIANTYIGYDFDQDGSVTDDACYFHYIQASNATTPPQYSTVTTSC